MANANMHAAKKEKNDEFYTSFEDINNEVKNYKEHFQNKTVFLNCDDPEWSQFWKYFEINFTHLGLKKLVATHFERDKPSYKLEIIGDTNDDGIVNHLDIIKTPLTQNGDFRSDEAIAILQEADIVVTNPPFSLFREYIAQLMEYDKKFLVIGNMGAVTYKEIFKLIKDKELWLGHTHPKTFMTPNGEKTVYTAWFTNLPTKKQQEELFLYKEYNPTEYPKYDNYDAINVDKVKHIPCDYYEAMGVPVTYLNTHNPDQFEIIDMSQIGNHCITTINGKRTYARVIIKRK